jgi:hypothetical protein
MERQQLIDKLKKHGESNPTESIKVIAGKKLIEMVFYLEAAKVRGFQVYPQKYYVFISNKGQVFECETPESSIEMALNNMSFDYSTVEMGDCVDFGFYGQFYVCGENISGNKFLVTSCSSQSLKEIVEKFYLEKSYAQGIIEKATIK